MRVGWSFLVRVIEFGLVNPQKYFLCYITNVLVMITETILLQ